MNKGHFLVFVIAVIVCVLFACMGQEITVGNKIGKKTKVTTENQTTTVKEKETTKKNTTKENKKSQAKLNEESLEYILNGRAQLDDGKFTILFGFSDEQKKELWINANVKVEIINNDEEIVFTGEYDITKKDFSTWNNIIKGDMYLASIVIDETNINKGNTEKGKVVLNVTTKEYGLIFENYEFDVDCLPYNKPSSNCSITLPQLPLIVNNYSWSGEVRRTVRIESIDVEWEDNYDGTVDCILNFSGEKIFDENGSESTFLAYKLYDSDGYVLDSGTFITDDLQAGDKFKDMEAKIYSLQPQAYKLEITDYN